MRQEREKTITMDQGRGTHAKTVAEVAAEERARLVAALEAAVRALEPFKQPAAPGAPQPPSTPERRAAPRAYLWERAGAEAAVVALCCALEDVLQYGQKREVGFLFGTKDYIEFVLLARGHVASVRPAWDFVAGGELRHARTRAGRGRALLAVALTKHFAQAALQHAAGSADALRDYYELWSVIATRPASAPSSPPSASGTSTSTARPPASASSSTPTSTR